MKRCLISFSGRKDGNCSAIAQVLSGAVSGRDNFTAAFRYHTGDAPPDTLFLSARSFGKVSISGDLMDSPEARAEVLRFIGA